MLDADFLARFGQHMQQMVALTDGQYLSQCIVLPTLPVYRELGIRALLRGHAGELLHLSKAYNYSLDAAALAITTEAQLRAWLLARLKAYMLDGVARPLFRGDLDGAMADLAAESREEDLAEVAELGPPRERIGPLFLMQRVRRETTLSLLKFRSVVEPRLPYLDAELVGRVLAAPLEMRLEEEVQTWILRRRRPAFVRVVNSNTGAPLGAGRWRRKLASVWMRGMAKLGVPGYQPYERLGLWLRRELAFLVRQVLLDPQTLDRGVYDPDGVRAVVRGHLEQGRNHTFLLMALMIFELGLRRLTQVGSMPDRTSPMAHGGSAPTVSVAASSFKVR
jgi:asparagine synthase (glutamine-hydrolysing)